MYSFSGFQSVNLLFFHFHDAVAFFPLMLLGLERLVNERKRTLFIFAVFLNCMTNYFFFISEVIFVILYYALRFWKKDLRLFLKDAIICLGCGIIGTGMAAILFLPSILYIIGSTKTNVSIKPLPLASYCGYIMLSVKGFLLPGEPMARQSCVVAEDYMSTCCYIPLIGGSLALSYIFTKKKDWLTKLLVLLWVISCSPTLDSSFYMFTQHYKRWWFMFVLMLITASVMVLDNRKKYRVKAGISANMILLLLFGGAILYLDQTSWTDHNFIYKKDIFFASCGISILGLLLTWFWCLEKRLSDKVRYGGLAVCISFFCSVTTFYTLSLYRAYAENGREYMKQYRLGLNLKNLDDQYRYNLSYNVLTYTGEAAGVGSFSSTISNSIQEFDSLFDFAWENQRPLSDFVVGVRELLGAKYYLAEEIPQGQKPVDMITVEGTDYYILEANACPIGFVQNSYITKDELKMLPVEKRGIAMIDNLVIDDEDEPVAAQYLSHNDNLNYTDDYKELPELVLQSQEKKTVDFKRYRSGFGCSVVSASDGAVFFTVPYDNGWNAYINGHKTGILDCGGMMGILIPPGQYAISFHYRVPGLKAGVWLSIAFLCVYILLIQYERKKQFSVM